jgi:hypothetical protein
MPKERRKGAVHDCLLVVFKPGNLQPDTTATFKAPKFIDPIYPNRILWARILYSQHDGGSLYMGDFIGYPLAFQASMPPFNAITLVYPRWR